MSKLKITADEFAERVNKAYDRRITVVKESYIGTRNKVTAYCNVHKIFFEVKAYTLSAKETNCPECSREVKRKEHTKPWDKMLKQFIEKYRNKFSYDESTYNGYKKEMKVHCNDCNIDFEITPEHHLKYNNGGCPNCHKTKICKCSGCGKEIVVDCHVNLNEKVYCDECKGKKKEKHKYCKVCGRKLNNSLNCDNDFCKNHSIRQFKTFVRYFNFDESKIGTIDVENEFLRIQKILYDMYWNKHMSSTEICNVFSYPSICNLTAKIFKYFEIPTKNVHQSSFENIKMGRCKIPVCKKYINGWHITWDNQKVYLRSSYEFDYA